jgi:Pyridoxamine 5'-phosphate oxidase
MSPTLRRNCTPVSLPVWYVVDGRTIVVRTPPRTKKVARVKRDARASFLVESGERWIDLLGVHLSGTVRIVDDAAEVSRLVAALHGKYSGFRPDAAVLPATTKARYATSTFLRFIPEGRILDVGELAVARGGSLATGTWVQLLCSHSS